MSKTEKAIENDQRIEIWKIKKLIKTLQNAKGSGTSMISLIIPHKDQINRASRLLTEEYGTASNIKSRVNRLSVLSAITSTQQKLKLYTRTPPNGLVIFCGTIITAEGKEKKVNIDFEPYKPINSSLYLCDNKFHTESLEELMEQEDKFGFIVIDGNGCLFASLSGNTKTILHQFSVQLPKKHGRGGQSALRFARLRLEKRHNYIRKVCEAAVKVFITDNKFNNSGLILAGSSLLKTELYRSDLFDARCKKAVIKTVDVSYGGQNGLNQAIELSSECLKNVKFILEKNLISKYFEQISQDTGKYCFGIEDTIKGLEMGAVKTLIVWEGLTKFRYLLENPVTKETKILYLSAEEKINPIFYRTKDGIDLDIKEHDLLIEWFAEHYKEFGTTLEFVTDKSQEGSQFSKGFGGIGGLLRWKVDFDDYENSDDDYEAFM